MTRSVNDNFEHYTYSIYRALLTLDVHSSSWGYSAPMQNFKICYFAPAVYMVADSQSPWAFNIDFCVLHKHISIS